MVGSAAPPNNYCTLADEITWHNLIENRENPQFSRHYDNNAVNIGQHYFHNVNFRFAQILIMKIMLTDIHGIFPH